MRILGVDGGGSAIRLRTSDGRAAEAEGVSPGGDVAISVAEAVLAAWRQGGFDPVDRAVLGLTTAPADPAEADRLGGLVGRGIGAPEVWVADDAVTAHAGALSDGWGVSLVAGTGVATLALPETGEPRIIGGHGPLLGDDGGAFWIGRHGIRAALRARDGMGRATALEALAEARFGPLDGLHVRLHDAPRPVDVIARFAPDVLDAADAGDTVAEGITAEAVGGLVALAAAGLAWIHAREHRDRRARVPVALGGRLLEPASPLARRLEPMLRLALPDADVRAADGTPLDGALRLGAVDGHLYGTLVHRWTGDAA